MNRPATILQNKPQKPTEREAKMTILLGINGTGKTTLLQRILQASGQKCLVITPDDAEWRDYPISELHTQEDFVYSGIKRHIFDPDKRNGTLSRLSYFKKGIIVFDDCRAYLTERTPPELRQMIIRRRQREIDIFAVGHGFKEVPPVFFTFLTEVILFRTTDNVAQRKNCLKDYELMAAAQARVNRQAIRNPHHYEIIRWQ